MGFDSPATPGAPLASGRRSGQTRAAVLACAGLIGLGAALVMSSGDALFLHRVGAEYLGHAFALSSALLVFVLASIGARADRGHRERIFLAVSFSALGVLGTAALTLEVTPRLSSSVVLIGGKQLSAALELAFWALLAERFDPRRLRRWLPQIIAAQGAGLALGATIAGLGAASLGVASLVILGSLALFGSGALGLVIARGGALRPLPTARLTGPPIGLGLRQGASAVRRSPVAARLVGLLALGGAFAPILFYLLGARADATFSSEADLAAFFGVFRAVVQIIAVVCQALIVGRVLGSLGTAGALIVAPVVALIGAALIAVRPELAAVVAVAAASKLVDSTLETPAHKLVQNLCARDQRGRISGFLDGVAKRAGAVVGGILAALLAPTALVIAAILVAVAWLAAALRFRRRFPQLAVEELFARSSESAFSEDEVGLSERGIAVLREALVNGGAPMERALAVLSELDGPLVNCSSELAMAISGADPKIASALASQLSARLDAGFAPNRLTSGLGDRLLTSLAFEIALVGSRLGGRFRAERTQRFSESENAAIDFCFEIASARESGPVSLELWDQALDQLWEAKQATDESSGESWLARACLGELSRALVEGSLQPGDRSRASRLLVRRVSDQDTGRQRASLANALAEFACSLRRGVGASEQAEWMLIGPSLAALGERLSKDKSPSVRKAGLELWVAASASIDPLVVATFLGDPSRPVAKVAARVLRSMGGEAIDALSRLAVYGRRRGRGPALEILGDLRVEPDLLDDLIEQEADALVSAALRRPGLAEIGNSELLVRRVSERMAESAHTMFSLIEARVAEPAIGVAVRRFACARHPTSRSRAIEALDAALPRRFAPLLSVLEHADLGASAAAASRFDGAAIPDSAAAIRSELADNDPLSRRIAIHTLDSAGRSSFRPEITEAANEALADADPQDVLSRLESLLAMPNVDEPVAGADQEQDEEVDMSKSIESVVVLSELPLFADLSTRELAELAEVVRWLKASVGDVLVREGEVGDAMYFVVDGEVAVERSGESGIEIATLGRGEPFGEMALFEDDVRSATVTVKRAGRLGRIDRGDFEDLAGEVPGIALGICRVLSRRVRLGNG